MEQSNLPVLIFAILIGLGTIWLVRWQIKQSKEGAMMGFNETLGTSTIYDVAKDAKAIQEGKKVLKPKVSTYLVPALILFCLGGIGFVPPIKTETLVIGMLFWFLAAILAAGSIWVHVGGKPIKNKAVVYTALFIYLAIMFAFIIFIIFPDIAKGEGLGAVVFFLVFAVGGSFYSYFSGKKNLPPSA